MVSVEVCVVSVKVCVCVVSRYLSVRCGVCGRVGVVEGVCMWCVQRSQCEV